jgi:hypothetical protein
VTPAARARRSRIAILAGVALVDAWQVDAWYGRIRVDVERKREPPPGGVAPIGARTILDRDLSEQSQRRTIIHLGRISPKMLIEQLYARTLRSAASIASQIRRNAGTPSTNSRTALPARTGYSPASTNGITMLDRR